MHEYDTVLENLLKNPQNTILERITGVKINHWLNVEFPEVQQTRVDLLGETADGRLIAMQLRSANDPKNRAPLAVLRRLLENRFGALPS